MDNQGIRVLHSCSCVHCETSPGGATAQEHDAINRVVAALDEKGRRLLAGLLAQQHGRGGIELLFQITGLSRNTIRRGQREIQKGATALGGRVRRPGGGRQRLEKKRPE